MTSVKTHQVTVTIWKFGYLMGDDALDNPPQRLYVYRGNLKDENGIMRRQQAEQTTPNKSGVINQARTHQSMMGRKEQECEIARKT